MRYSCSAATHTLATGGSTSTSQVHFHACAASLRSFQLLSPLCRLGSGSARVSQYLALLELSAGGQAWLRTSWGIRVASCRAAVLRAQSTLQQLVDTAAETFRHMFSCQFNPSLDQLHISATVQRVRNHVLKQLDHDLRNTQYQLILECVLQLSLPRLLQGLGQQDLSHYEQLVDSDYAPFLQPHVLYHQVLREHLSQEIREVMKHSLPRHCIPLPAGGLSDHVSEDGTPPEGPSRPCSRLSPSASLSSSVDSYENIQE
ncbi:protein Niban-like [Scleropages formosus]|uniref:protein Niban-like n=1 Tax=Scleropages formosus TaxID=113540 RepID=UPI0008785CC8|nr:protein Niban-like [Scleropages formosus]